MKFKECKMSIYQDINTMGVVEHERSFFDLLSVKQFRIPEC
jgi:hypothetical protein